MEILNSYKIRLKVEFRNYKFYYSGAKRFLEYLEYNNVHYKEITYNIMDSYILSMKQSMKNNTINNNLKAIRHFYRFLYARNLVPTSIVTIATQPKYLKEDINIKKWLNYENMKDIVSRGKEYINFYSSAKTEAILWFMFFTGMRKDEFINLKRSDLDFDNERVLITKPKAVNGIREQRLAPFPEEYKFDISTKTKPIFETIYLHRLVKKYFADDKEEKNAFNVTYEELNAFHTELKDCTIDRTFNLHMLRRSFANQLASDGMALHDIQNFMGHKDSETTKLYVKPGIEDSFIAYKKMRERM